MAYPPEAVEKIKTHFPCDLLALSRNSATSVLVIWDIVAKHFYEVDLAQTVDKISNCLIAQNEFLSHIRYEPTGFFSLLKDSVVYEYLTIDFFAYYFERLPILFHGCPMATCLRPSRTQQERIAMACLRALAGSYEDEKYSIYARSKYTLLKTFRRNWWKANWSIRRGTKDSLAYDMDWLWHVFGRLFPALVAGEDNVTAVTTHILESCFPMYWNAITDAYRQRLDWISLKASVASYTS